MIYPGVLLVKGIPPISDYAGNGVIPTTFGFLDDAKIKYYDQGDEAFGMTNVSTYQSLDIQIDGDRLVYRAYDMEGDLRDRIVIEK